MRVRIASARNSHGSSWKWSSRCGCWQRAVCSALATCCPGDFVLLVGYQRLRLLAGCVCSMCLHAADKCVHGCSVGFHVRGASGLLSTCWSTPRPQELRKAASQQMREVAVSQNETVRTISEEKAAAERREAGLREETARLSQRLDAANTCIEALQGELSLLQQVGPGD